MKKKLVAVLLAAPLLMGTTVAATPAAAEVSVRSVGCVSNYEWNAFQIGWGKGATERLFDTRGWTVWSSNSYWVKKYDHCGWRYDVVKVKYEWNGWRWVVKNGWRW